MSLEKNTRNDQVKYCPVAEECLKILDESWQTSQVIHIWFVYNTIGMANPLAENNKFL